MPRPRAVLPSALSALALSLSLTACASADAGGSGAGDGDGADGEERVSVLASFYPLQFVAQEIGGDLVTVDNLTPPAAEPHDLELSPSQVRAIGQADLVVYLSGFQPAVDAGVEARRPDHVVDAADVVTLAEHPGSAEHPESAEHSHEGEDDGHDHGSLDPHFWLDPTRLAQVVQPVAEELAAVDPDHADQYATAAAALEQRLADLDGELEAGLAGCEGATLVTSHAAFGYLAERYGLQQVGISGIDPEAEPSPARLREIGTVVREHGVTTLFSETLLSPKITQTLAADLGVRTATLDTLEGLSDDQHDFVSVMQHNLATLQEGLVCA